MRFFIAACLSYIVFSLGSLPDGTPTTTGGMLFIGIFESKPNPKSVITPTGVYLFSFEL